MRNSLLSTLLIAGTFLCGQAQAGARTFVKAQGRGVNLGNMLEAPSEGAWTVVLKQQDLPLIASKGFTNVRIPIRWDGVGVGTAKFDRVARTAPYTVDSRFFARVDSAIAWSRQNRLTVLINDHHHDSLFQNLEHETPRFLALWQQIAERYKDLPDSVAFEILNEPNTQVTIDAWNSLLDTTLKVIRKSNPTRPVVIGTANWGGLSGLSGLKLPAGDTNLILTIHYYEPFSFTHQGANWVTPEPPLGVLWEGTYYEKLAVKQAMEAIADYSKANGDIPVFVGEFGAYSMADSASRGRWAGYCARLFESYSFSWAWWEFKAGFGVYDEGSATWNAGLTDPLLSNDVSNLALGEPTVGGKDLVVNGGFASKAGWKLNASQGKSTLSIDTSRALVTTTAAGSDAWGIQLIQTPVVLKKGLTHVLQFDAWASSPRAIDGTVGMSVDPWTGYATAAAGLKTTSQTFFTSFVPAVTDSTARICFNLGPDTGKIFIDNVKLLVWGDTATAAGVAGRNAVLRANVRWEHGQLVSNQATLPALNQVTSMDGRRVALLNWVRTGQGWKAALPTLAKGTWLLQGLTSSVRFVVTD